MNRLESGVNHVKARFARTVISDIVDNKKSVVGDLARHLKSVRDVVDKWETTDYQDQIAGTQEIQSQRVAAYFGEVSDKPLQHANYHPQEKEFSLRPVRTIDPEATIHRLLPLVVKEFGGKTNLYSLEVANYLSESVQSRLNSRALWFMEVRVQKIPHTPDSNIIFAFTPKADDEIQSIVDQRKIDAELKQIELLDQANVIGMVDQALGVNYQETQVFLKKVDRLVLHDEITEALTVHGEWQELRVNSDEKKELSAKYGFSYREDEDQRLFKPVTGERDFILTVHPSGDGVEKSQIAAYIGPKERERARNQFVQIMAEGVKDALNELDVAYKVHQIDPCSILYAAREWVDYRLYQGIALERVYADLGPTCIDLLKAALPDMPAEMVWALNAWKQEAQTISEAFLEPGKWQKLDVRFTVDRVGIVTIANGEHTGWQILPAKFDEKKIVPRFNFTYTHAPLPTLT